jgi:transcriptional regulator with PAS, ATPase and Fis domain
MQAEDPSSSSGTHLTGVTVRMETNSGELTAVIPPLRVTVTDGPDRGSSHQAAGTRFVIGVHEKADFVLQDTAVSRFHCEIGLEDERVAIRDLGSRNGTAVNGTSVVHAHLAEGAVIEIGRTKLRFGLEGDPVRLEIAQQTRFGSMVGQSLAMRCVFAELKRAAASDASVLLSGETGTGKEIAAESLHALSARSAGPYIIVDCGAIPPQLLESELFGHERGAFTGAMSARRGAFEAAQGGTIFLDEVGELGVELQPKLLRVLERRQIKRVGGAQYKPVDFRLVAATNRDLQQEVNARRFRADLYYRLAVVELRLPTLRERPDDIPLLVEQILETLDAGSSAAARMLRAPTCLAELSNHSWPGNVRELRNYVERSIALAGAQSLRAFTTSGSLVQREAQAQLQTYRSARGAALAEFERQYLQALLAHHGDNVAHAARSAGIDRKYLYRLLWKHGLR